MRVLLRGVGWMSIAVGATILLYLVYSLFWTTLETRSAQARLLEQWQAQVGTVEGEVAVPSAEQDPVAAPAGAADDPVVTEDGGETAQDGAGPGEEPGPSEAVAAPPPSGEALAAMSFVRPDEGRLLHDEPILVVEGVGTDDLRAGPGHYPWTSLPGEDGNFAVAGHRTTYGAPFYDLDKLRAGDEVHVTDRSGRRWVYRVVDSRIVGPAAIEVLDPDPLGRDRPMLTLTTCNPRFSNAQRLVVFAELDDGGSTA